MPISVTYLTAIQKFEGFSQKANWDYAQYTNGYGTKARSPTEMISRAEAESRFKVEIAQARDLVEGFAPHLDRGTKAALTSLTFNAGTAWMKSGLGQAVKSGDLDQARNIFIQYNKAGGQVLPGLVARRTAEASWIGSTAEPSTASTATQSTGAVSRAWVRDVFDPSGHHVQKVDNELAASPSSSSIFGEMSAQFMAQLSLNIWDFLSWTDAAEQPDKPGKNQTEV